MPRSELLVRLALLTSSAMFSLLLAELLVRFVPGPWAPSYGFFLKSGGSLEPTIAWHANAQVGWLPRPLQQLENRTTEFTARITTNSLGFRGPGEWIESRRPIVAILGDSMVEAFQVDDSETFGSLLAARLSGSRGEPTQVWNLGVSSFGPPHYLKVYRRYLADRRPDIVLIVFFAANDIEDSSPELKTIKTLQPRYDWRDDQPQEVLDFDAPLTPTPGVWAAAKAWIARRSHLYRRLVWARYAVRPGGTAAEVQSTTPSDSPATEKGWRLALWATRKLHAEASTAGARVLVVLMPARGDVLPGHRSASRLPRLRTALREAGVSYVDLSAPLEQAYARGVEVHFPLDGHLTCAGHRVVAGALEQPITALLQKAHSAKDSGS